MTDFALAIVATCLLTVWSAILAYGLDLGHPATK